MAQQEQHLKGFQWEFDQPAPQPESTRPGEGAAAVARGAAGGFAPTAIRLGVAIPQIAISKVPGIGNVIAGGMGGAAEILAQLLETRGKDINWGRVGIESALAATPLGGEIKLGRHVLKLGANTVGKAAAKGAAMAGAGVVGRKATDSDPEASALDPRQYGLWDAAQVGIGGTIGGMVGKATGKDSIDDLVKGATNKPRETPRLVTEPPETQVTMRSEDPVAPVVREAQVKGLRSDDPKAPDFDLDQKIESGEKVAAAQRMVNEKGDKAAQRRIVDKEKAATAANNLKFKEWQQEARNSEAARKYLEKVAKDTDADALRVEKERMAWAMQESRNRNAADAYNKAQERAKAVEERLRALQASGGKAQTTVTQTASMDTPSGDVTARTVIAEPKKRGGKAPTAATPSAPPAGGPAPKPGTFQVVDKSNRVVAELTTPEDTLELVNAAGPAAGLRVIEPAEAVKPAAKAPEQAPFNPPRMAEPKPAATTPPTSGKEAKLAESDSALDQLESIEALTGGAGIRSVPGRGTMPADAPQAPVSSGMSLPAPIAFKVAEESQRPPGAEFARFFRSPQQAQLAQDYTQKLSPELNELFYPILAKYEAQAKRSPQARHFGELLSKMRQGANLPARPTMPKATKAGGRPAPPVPKIPEVVPQATPEAPSAPTIEGVLSPEQQAFRQQVIDEIGNTNVSDLQGEELSRLTNFLNRFGGEGGGEKGEINPELAQVLFQRIAPGLLGAGIGGAMSDEDPLSGAILGGAAGLAGGSMLPKLLQRVPSPTGASPSIPERIVNWQRFALLSNPYNLAVNTLAPTGGGIMGSLERMAQGAIARDPNTTRQGWEGLKAVGNPMRFKDFGQDFNKATRLLVNSDERADMAMSGGAPSIFDSVTAFPATVMTAGDIGARGALQNKANWTEDAARAVTVSSEPRYKFPKAAVNLARQGGNIGRFMLPFSRTAANVIEGSFERTPILGLLARRSQENPELQATISEIAARQGMGGLVGFAAYQLGQEVDPEVARQRNLPLILANMSGQYGALAAAAFAAGLASQGGASGSDQAKAFLNSGWRDLPLPTTESPQEMGEDLATLLLDRQPVDPGADHIFQRWIPDPILPRALKDTALNNDVLANFEWEF